MQQVRQVQRCSDAAMQHRRARKGTTDYTCTFQCCAVYAVVHSSIDVQKKREINSQKRTTVLMEGILGLDASGAGQIPWSQLPSRAPVTNQQAIGRYLPWSLSATWYNPDVQLHPTVNKANSQADCHRASSPLEWPPDVDDPRSPPSTILRVDGASWRRGSANHGNQGTNLELEAHADQVGSCETLSSTVAPISPFTSIDVLLACSACCIRFLRGPTPTEDPRRHGGISQRNRTSRSWSKQK